MKRNFKLIAAVLVLAVMALTLASCEYIEGTVGNIKDKVDDVVDKFVPHEHEFSADWSSDATNHWHAAICDKKDDCASATADLAAHTFADGVCSVCGYKAEEEAPHDHNYVDGKCECGAEDPDYVPACTEHAYSIEVTKEATCTEDGEKTFTCTVCGYSETQTIAPLGHEEKTVDGKAPTCTETGLSKGKVCNVCGTVITAQSEIAATGHSFVEGACSACGEADPDYNGPKTYLFETNTVVIYGEDGKPNLADKAEVPAGSTYVDGYFTITGLVTQRTKNNAVYCVELGKQDKGGVQFTVNGTATVEILFHSTSGSNTSWIGLRDAEGNLIDNNEGLKTVTGTGDGLLVTYTLGAGTYTVCSPALLDENGEDPYNRTVRLYSISVTETPAEEEPAKEIKVETTDTYTMYDLDFFTFTATAEGYYTFKIPAGLGVLKDGANAPEIDYYDNANGYEFTIGLKADQEVKFWVSSTTKDLWTIEWSFEEGEVKEDEPDTPIEGDATELVVGSNTVVFGEGELSEGKTYPFVVTEEGTYTFRCDLMAVVMDADGNTMGRGQAYLVPGNYTVALFSMMPMPANSFVVNITFEAPASGEPDGSEQYPYVLETLPESVVVDYDVITGKVYYIFTATADGSVTFTWPVEYDSWYDYFELDENGNLTSNNGSGFMATSHTFVVEAGKSYRVSLGSWSEAGSHTITIAFVSCDHEWSEATCETPSTCSKCGATTGDKAEHTPNTEEPTCSNPSVCTVCGMELGYVDHVWGEPTDIIAPDCSTMTDGSQKLTCTDCGHEETETLWASHDWDYSQCVEATCTTNGKYHAVCTVCGEIDSYDIEAGGHYNWYATCGETTNCMACGEEFTLEHDLFPADCFSPATCSNCWQSFGEPLTHNYVDGVCEYCYGVDPDYVPPHVHSYFYPCDPVCQDCGELSNPDAAHTIVHVEANAATCYENGNIEYWYCSDCGYAWADEALTLVTNLKAVVLPMAHAEATHVEAKAANCGVNGNIEHWYCAECGQAWLDADCTLNTNLKAVILPATGEHDYDHIEVAPTCTKAGYTEHICAICDDTYTDTEVDVLPHADDNGDYKCDACSTKMLPADGEALTIPQALAIAKLAGTSYTTQKYYITGIVTNVYNTQYGNLYLKDAEGNQICIYGLYTWNKATRYDAMDYKPVEGDELTVYTVLGMYNTTCQGKDAWVDEVVAHEHDYSSKVTDPTCTRGGYTTHTCSICQGYYVDSETEALGHTTENGECERCGQTIGGDVVNNETFTADLTTLGTNTTYGSYKTTSGWQTTNCAVVGGGTSNSNPKFICIGDASNRGVVLNGKTSAKGKLVSPTLSGGISAITFQYTNVFSESKGVDLTITIKQNGVVVATKQLDDNSVTQYTAETFTWDLAAEGVAVSGDFTIEITNNSPSNSTSNKDRTAIWNIAWTTNY